MWADCTSAFVGFEAFVNRLETVHADAHLLSSIRCCKVVILNGNLFTARKTDNSTALLAVHLPYQQDTKGVFTHCTFVWHFSGASTRVASISLFIHRFAS